MFSDNGDKYINRDSNPDLSFYSVLGGAVEPLDTQMLFDPFEEQFDLPTTFVERTNSERWKGSMIGKKHIRLASVCIFVPYAP